MPVSHLCRWHRVMKFLLAHQDRPKACVVRAVAADVMQGVPRPALCVKAQARCKWAWVAVEHLKLLIFPSLQILLTLCLRLSKKTAKRPSFDGRLTCGRCCSVKAPCNSTATKPVLQFLQQT